MIQVRADHIRADEKDVWSRTVGQVKRSRIIPAACEAQPGVGLRLLCSSAGQDRVPDECARSYGKETSAIHSYSSLNQTSQKHNIGSCELL